LGKIWGELAETLESRSKRRRREEQVVVVEAYLAMATIAIYIERGRRQMGKREELAGVGGGTAADKRRWCGTGEGEELTICRLPVVSERERESESE